MNLVIANAGTGQKIRATAGSQRLILSFCIVDGESYILLLSCYYVKPVFTIMNDCTHGFRAFGSYWFVTIALEPLRLNLISVTLHAGTYTGPVMSCAEAWS